MADVEKGAGKAVTHKLKHSTGKGGDEHAARPGSDLIGCTGANARLSRPGYHKMHAMYLTVQ